MKHNFPIDEICKRYINGEKLDDLRAFFKTSQEKIRKILIDNNINIRKRGKKMSISINGARIKEGEKICPKCKAVKNKIDFDKCAQRSDGLQTYCIVCRRKMINDGKKKRYANDLEYRIRMKEYHKKLYLKYKDKNKDKNDKYNKEYREKNREQIRIRHSLWREKNRKVLNEKITKYRNKRKSYDIEFKILCNLRSRINNAFNATACGSKSRKTKDFIGCDFKYLVNYLESKFGPGMSWRNYGKNGWHIDHIIPCAAFDLTNKEQQDKCFHYTNLQPLWATTEIARQNGDFDSIGNINKNNKLL